jgi:hypothetical protein
MKSNCLFWALKEVIINGGYLLIRKSHLYSGPHFLHGYYDNETKSIKIRHFVPKDPKLKITPPFIFEGEVKNYEEYHE